MKANLLRALFLAALPAMLAPTLGAQAIGLPEISKESQDCMQCHKKEHRGIYQQWGASKHFRANVGCYECHAAEKSDKDAFNHYDHTIAVLVTPKDCGRCHPKEVKEFVNSHHAKGGRILGSLDNHLAEVVEGNRAMITPAFPNGNSAAAVNGCWQCHGSQIAVLADGRLDPRPIRTAASAASTRMAPRAPATPATCAMSSQRLRRGIRTPAASATWAPTTRRRRSTKSRSTASRSSAMKTR
jgi:hypothetical protein